MTVKKVIDGHTYLVDPENTPESINNGFTTNDNVMVPLLSIGTVFALSIIGLCFMLF